MRTATTIAETHGGKEVLVSGRKIGVHTQLQNFRKLIGRKSHPDFAFVALQESDGHLRTLRFLTPQGEKEDTAARAKQANDLQAAAAKSEKEKEESAARVEAARERIHQDEIKALNKQREETAAALAGTSKINPEPESPDKGKKSKSKT